MVPPNEVAFLYNLWDFKLTDKIFIQYFQRNLAKQNKLNPTLRIDMMEHHISTIHANL